MKQFLIFLIILHVSFQQGMSQMTDIEGNVYKTVIIGKQTWMAENLRTKKFKNGDPIPHVPDEKDWNITFEEEKPGWCVYNNDPSFQKKYGLL